jgi:hypothetical protein
VTQVVVPAVTGAIGVAGGVLLGRSARQRRRKILGIPIPAGGGIKVDLSDIGKNVGAAGRQFGKLAREVQTARETAEKVSRAIS